MSDEEQSRSENEVETAANRLIRRKHESSDDEDGVPAKFQRASDNSKVVAAHYNDLEEKGCEHRSKSRIVHMRNFNNWIKTMLINKYLTEIKSTQKLGDPLRVLDMCCGKGGDLLKWQKAGITHLICTDIAEISVEQCKSRYNSVMERMKRTNFTWNITAEFFDCDSTITRLRTLYNDPSISLNLVSCQFAFHYCFESLSQAERMVQNAAECLKPGGFFIATIPNAYEIMKRQNEAQSKKFGNEIYEIEFVCDTERPPLFGAKYKFHLEGVVDCPEFLVHFPMLVKLCRKYGLELVQKDGFADFYQKSLENDRDLLSRMQALETYPPPHGKKLAGVEADYAHAQKHLKENSGNNLHRNRSIGTLSASEWEAINLYLVSAFRKCEHELDSQGNPVYKWSSA